MMSENLIKLWEEMAYQAEKAVTNPILKNKNVKENIRFMKKLGFAPEFLEAAKNYRGLSFYGLQIDWMLSWLQRQNRFYELRPRMFPIGSDGCGNLIYLYDVAKKNTSVVFYCHDPAIIMVIAENIFDFLEHILKLSSRVDIISGKQSLLDAFIEDAGLRAAITKIWDKKIYNGMCDDLYLKYSKSENKVEVDFSRALPGAGVSLAYFGKFTEIYYTSKANVISVEKMETDGEVKLKAKDKNSTVLYIAGTLMGVVSLILLGESVMKSLFLSILGMTCLMVLPYYIIRIFKREPRL